jgi:hypothetical protein
VKECEIIADNLHKAGWSLGWVSVLDLKGRTIWIVLTRTAMTEGVSSFAPTKYSARLLNLKQMFAARSAASKAKLHVKN